MARIGEIRWLVQQGLYELVEHAVEEMDADGLNEFFQEAGSRK